MGIWDCLSCWNTFPSTCPETYETRDCIVGENCEFDILVEKLIVIGVPFPLLCPGTDDRCCNKNNSPKHKISQNIPVQLTKKTQTVCSVQKVTPAVTCRTMMSNHKRKLDTSDDTNTTENDEDQQPIDDNDHAKSIISRSSQRSELNDERSLVNETIKINTTASGAGIVVQNPQTYEEKYYRDFILKYGTIFAENIKDPIPKDPDPVNPSNIVKVKPLNIPTNLPSTSQRNETKTNKQVKIGPISSIHKSPIAQKQLNVKKTVLRSAKQQDASEIELESIDAENDSDSYISVMDRYTQTTDSIPETSTLKLNYETQNIALGYSSLSVTTTSEADSSVSQLQNKDRIGKIIINGPQETQVEDPSSDINHGKKALRWKIIIRHQAPSTEQAESMTDEINSEHKPKDDIYSDHKAKDEIYIDHKAKDIRKDSSASSDSGYLQYDYVDD